MSTSNWRDTILSTDATLSAALQSLDTTALQIVLVLDERGLLRGTLTDGDVRRALIRGESLDSPVTSHMKLHPITIPVDANRQQALDILRRMAVRSAPVVDSSGQVIDLLNLNESAAPEQRNTPAVIMAGGRGTRLRPVTDSVPKPLVPISGEPLIDITTRRLVAHGFRNIWVATHYKTEEIQDHLGDGRHIDAEIRYIAESRPMGTAGAVREVPVSADDSPILVCNADNIHTIHFGALLDFHSASGALATLALSQHITEVPFGVATVDGGLVLDLVEKPRRIDLVASGVSVLTQRALSLFPETEPLDVPTVISELLFRGLRVGAFESEGYWGDIGTPESLDRIQAQHDWLTRLDSPPVVDT